MRHATLVGSLEVSTHASCYATVGALELSIRASEDDAKHATSN